MKTRCHRAWFLLFIAATICCLSSCGSRPEVATEANSVDSPSGTAQLDRPDGETDPADEVDMQAEASANASDEVSADAARPDDNPANTQPQLVVDVAGHSERIRRAHFTADGSELITVSRDGTIQFWSVQSGERIRIWRPYLWAGHSHGFESSALSDDGGTLVVAGSYSNSVLDKKTNQPKLEKFSRIFVFDVATGSIRRTILSPQDGIPHIAISPDGKYLLTGGAFKILLWRLADGERLHSLKGHKFWTVGFAFSPDSQSVATTAWDGTVRVWDVASGKEQKTIRMPRGVSILQSVDWSRDGQRLVSLSKREIVVWSRDGEKLKVIDQKELGLKKNEQEYKISSLRRWRDSDEFIASWNQPGTDHFGLVKLDPMTLKTERVAIPAELGAVPTGVRNSDTWGISALSRDGTWAAAINNTVVQLWRMGETKLSHSVSEVVTAPKLIQWRADGKAIGWSDDDNGAPRQALDLAQVQLLTHDAFQTYRGRLDQYGQLSLTTTIPEQKGIDWYGVIQIQQQQSAPVKVRAYRLHDWTLVPGWERQPPVLLASSGAQLHQYDLNTGKKLREAPVQLQIASIAPSPDGRWIAIAARDRLIHILNRQFETRLKIFTKGTDWIAWTPEGFYAASPGGEKLIGWQVNRRENELADFFSAEQFRDSLYRPARIRQALELDAGTAAVKAPSTGDPNQKPNTPITAATDISSENVATLLPPQVRFTQPAKRQLTVREKTLTVRAIAESRQASQPVTRMQLLIEGRPTRTERSPTSSSAPTSASAAKTGKMEMEWTVSLLPGKQRLQVVANSEVSQGRSEEIDVTYVPSDKQEGFENPDLYLLAIGINAYADPSLRLRLAVNDATELSQTFEKHGRGTVFRRVTVKLLTDSQANRQGVLEGLRWLSELRLSRHDVVAVFFAGHGDKDSQGQFYLLPQDAQPQRLETTAIPGSLLNETLIGLESRVLLMLDACHSGRIGGLDDLRRKLTRYEAGVVVMCAADELTKAGEKGKHGFFTQSLIEGLSGEAPRSSRDGAIYLSALNGYVDDRVRELSDGQQIPVIDIPSSVRSFALSKPAE